MPKSIPMLPDLSLPSHPEDYIYILRGTGLDRDCKVAAKELAPAIIGGTTVTEAPPEFSGSTSIAYRPDCFNSWVMGVDGSGATKKLDLLYALTNAIANHSASTRASSEDEYILTMREWAASGGRTAVGVGKSELKDLVGLMGGFKVVQFDANPSNPMGVQEYTIGPTDRNLMIFASSKDNTHLSGCILHGVLPAGATVIVLATSTYCSSSQPNGIYKGIILAPDMNNENLVVVVGQNVFHRVITGPNPGMDIHWYYFQSNFGEFSEDPDIWVNKMRGTQHISFKNGNTLLEANQGPTTERATVELRFHGGTSYDHRLFLESGAVCPEYGLQLPAISTYPPITSNSTSRLQYDGEDLVWNKGKTSGGVDRGKTIISHPSQDTFNHAVSIIGQNLANNQLIYPLVNGIRGWVLTDDCITDVVTLMISLEDTNLDIGEWIDFSITRRIWSGESSTQQTVGVQMSPSTAGIGAQIYTVELPFNKTILPRGRRIDYRIEITDSLDLPKHPNSIFVIASSTLRSYS